MALTQFNTALRELLDTWFRHDQARGANPGVHDQLEAARLTAGHARHFNFH